MRLSIVIACMNQLEDTKCAWGNLVANTAAKSDTELVVIDNGSTDGTRDFLTRFVFPHFPIYTYIYHPENAGVLASLQKGYELSTGDVIAYLHNDVYVLESGWNTRVLTEFTADPKLGMAGFLGARGAAANGGRSFVLSNLLEAEAHGAKIEWTEECILFDGLAMICRRAMLDQVGGFDQGYCYHHFYDKDMSLASYKAGWTNKVIPIFCHHRSGTTANRPDYEKWVSKKLGVEEGKGGNESYLKSESRFLEKWKDYLPRSVGQSHEL